jgi:hypothetical protein
MTPVPYPRVEPIGGNRYRLFEAYAYVWAKDGARYRLVVPVGFTSDLASVPRLLWVVISPFDLGAAVVPHDWLYANAGRPPPGSWQVWRDGDWVEDGRPWKRREADRLFGRLMREVGVSRFKRRAAYLAVRLFGAFAWGRGATPGPPA